MLALGGHDRDGPVVVTVPAMGMMEMPVNEKVDVVAVWNRFVAAALTVGLRGIMPPALVTVRAAVGVLLVYLEDVLIDVVAVGMMQVAIV